MRTLDEITDLEERLREAELGPVLRVWLKRAEGGRSSPGRRCF